MDGGFLMIQKKQIIRILSALESVALPQTGDGARTMSISGMTHFVRDMRDIKHFISSIKQSLIYDNLIEESDIVGLENIAKWSNDETN